MHMADSKQTILIELLKQQKAETAPELTDDGFFNLYSSEQILKDFGLSYDEIKDGVVEGGGDGGMDSIYTFVNGELVEEDSDFTGLKKDIVIDLVIIQSKRTTGFAEEPLNKLIASAQDLLNLSNDLDSFNETYNKGVLTKLELFKNTYLRLVSRFPKLSISYCYSTLGNEVHDNVKRKVEQLRRTIDSLISDVDFNFFFIGTVELLTLARKKPITVKTLKVEGTAIDTRDGGYICLVSLPDYFVFISNEGKLLRNFFDANVRDYQGKIEVNKAIAESLRNPNKEDFWWLNNGITITTTKTTLTSGILTIEDPQIVNGLQSSHEIFNHFNSGGDKADPRKILVRVIKPSDEKSRLKIIKATNSQTSVPIASLRATDEIHLNIEDYFLTHGFFYDRRKNHYKNSGKALDKIISIPLLSQIVTATILQEPDNSRARPSTLIKNDEEYVKIFNSEYDVAVYLKVVLIQKKLDGVLKTMYPELSTTVIGDIRFHVAMFTVANELKSVTYAANHLLRINEDSITDEKIKENIGEVLKLYNELGGNNKVAKSKEFVRAIFGRLGELVAEHKEMLRQAQATRDDAGQQ